MSIDLTERTSRGTPEIVCDFLDFLMILGIKAAIPADMNKYTQHGDHVDSFIVRMASWWTRSHIKLRDTIDSEHIYEHEEKSNHN